MERKKKDAAPFSGRKQVIASKNEDGSYDYVELAADGTRRRNGASEGFGFADNGGAQSGDSNSIDARGQIRDQEQQTVDMATTNKVCAATATCGVCNRCFVRSTCSRESRHRSCSTHGCLLYYRRHARCTTYCNSCCWHGFGSAVSCVRYAHHGNSQGLILSTIELYYEVLSFDLAWRRPDRYRVQVEIVCLALTGKSREYVEFVRSCFKTQRMALPSRASVGDREAVLASVYPSVLRRLLRMLNLYYRKYQILPVYTTDGTTIQYRQHSSTPCTTCAIMVLYYVRTATRGCLVLSIF